MLENITMRKISEVKDDLFHLQARFIKINSLFFIQQKN